MGAYLLTDTVIRSGNDAGSSRGAFSGRRTGKRRSHVWSLRHRASACIRPLSKEKLVAVPDLGHWKALTVGNDLPTLALGIVLVGACKDSDAADVVVDPEEIASVVHDEASCIAKVLCDQCYVIVIAKLTEFDQRLFRPSVRSRPAVRRK
jgi:hypothetical protein